MNRVPEKKGDDQNEKTPPLFRNDSKHTSTLVLLLTQPKGMGQTIFLQTSPANRLLLSCKRLPVMRQHGWIDHFDVDR